MESKKFTTFRKIKHLKGTAVQDLIQEVNTKIKTKGFMTFSPSIKGKDFDNCTIKRTNDILRFGNNIRTSDNLKDILMLAASEYFTMGIFLSCDTGQKLPNATPIRQVWGFRIHNDDNLLTLERISSNDLYTSCTTDNQTGQTMPADEDTVYCGPDGQICGWDID